MIFFYLESISVAHKLQLLVKYFARVANKNRQLQKSHFGRHLVVAGWSIAVGKERNIESPCQESALFIDNKASERATQRCDEGKYSASISVRGCLSILDEYKVLRFRLPPSPSRRNKFALARVKRGESPRSAGGRADRRERVRESGKRVRSRRLGGQAGGKKGEGRIREEMEEANGKRRRKSRARNSRLRWEFSKLPDLLRSPFPPSRTFPPLIRSPPSALPAALRRVAAHDRVSTAVSDGNACVYKRLCRFHVMRNPPQSCFALDGLQNAELEVA